MKDLAGNGRPTTSARHFIREALAGWRLPKDLVDSIELVVSELVANAVKHGNGAETLRVGRSGRELRVEIDDLSERPPRVMHPEPLREGHRGLLIVDAMSTSWGCLHSQAGKTVWAEFAVTAGSPAAE